MRPASLLAPKHKAGGVLTTFFSVEPVDRCSVPSRLGSALASCWGETSRTNFELESMFNGVRVARLRDIYLGADRGRNVVTNFVG